MLVRIRFSEAFTRLLVLALIGFGPLSAWAQNAKLAGKVIDKATKEPIPFAAIKLFSGGALKGGSIADFDGNYSISPVNPGTYDLEASAVGYTPYKLEKITIAFEETKRIQITLTEKSTETGPVIIEAYKKELIGVSNGEKVSLSADEIAKIPTRNVNTMIATQANVYSADDGQGVNIKGMRTSDNAVFINGIRQFGTSLPPAEAISELSIVSGGIPAQYGDALGGIISITTKSAAQKLSFGVQGETSSLFDQWHYNFVGLNASGPIFRKKEFLADGTETDGKTVLGFFGALQFTSNVDASPSALPIYKATDASINQIRNQPLTRFGNSYTSTANFFTMDNLHRVKARPNMGSRAIQSNFNLDFQPSDNIILTVGGNVNYSGDKLGPNEGNGGDAPDPNSYQNLFNYSNNAFQSSWDFNGFIRFRQTFNTGMADTGSLLKNVYYQVQADYTNRFRETYDTRFYNRLNEYNYLGKFDITRDDILLDRDVFTTVPEIDGLDSAGNPIVNPKLYTSTDKKRYQIMNTPTGTTFTPSTLNPDLAAINTQLYRDNNIFSDNFLLTQGGYLNGTGSGGIADNAYFFPALGKSMRAYSKASDQQIRFSFQAAAEIKNHNLKIGAEFEQRIIANYGTGGSLFPRARQQLNAHIFNQGVTVRLDTVFSGTDTVIKLYQIPYVGKVDENGRPIGQTDFDANFRRRNNIPVNEVINLDAYGPNAFSINDFSVTNILDGGNNPLAAWQGYSAYGKFRVFNRSSFFDFFTDTLNRPIDAFRPLYYAGFIEDKFEIGDLILRLGLRVDAFDVNTPVLRDKFSLTKLLTAKEYYSNAGLPKPNSVGDDWSVYVNQPARNFNGSNYNEYSVVGYRNGDVWYDANGFETSNPASLEVNGTVNPFYDVQNKSTFDKNLQRTTGITLDAFRDFAPQINFMPRISFSFPISETSLFYAHYDVLTQRPLGVDANGTLQQNYAAPIDYYSMLVGGGGYINNPNLRPQKKIDYALGFQQALNSRSAIKLSAFYSEIKDLIQVINVNYAYPIRYQTSGNQDFSVVKGLSLQYDLRRSENFTATASYTLSFAEGSASNFAGALLNTSTPNLRNTTPVNYDQRHAVKLNFDYRFLEGEGPEVFGMHPFENLGLNATFYAGSGTPYTQDGSAWGGRYQVRGSINGSRLPWNNRTSVRVDKSFIFKQPGKRAHSINVYLYVQNLFDAQNVLGVYSRTGSPSDNGYLVSDYGKQQVSQQVSPESYVAFYNLLMANPDNISLPRRFRLGVSYNF